MNDEGAASATVNVSGSQGVQVGANNVQNNTWTTKAPLDVASLRRLTPHAAAARLQMRSHEDLADFFAETSSAGVQEILKALVAVDDALVVAVFAELHPDRVYELVEPLPDEVRLWLDDLPVAVEAISSRALDLQWHRGGKAGHLERDGFTYFRAYEKGSVYWSAQGGAHGIKREFLEAYKPSELGYPSAEEENLYQSFENGYIAWTKFGIFSVSGEIFRKFGSIVAGDATAGREDFASYSRQRFQYGTIYSSKYGVFFVTSEVDAKIGSALPTEDYIVATSPHGTTGITQRFQEESGEEVLVCSFERPQGGRQTYRLRGRTLVYFTTSGGVESLLGFPVTEPERVRGRAWLQWFESGPVYDRDGHETLAVPTATFRLIGIHDGGTKVGWPVSEEKPTETGDGDRVQFFEHGVVTLRNRQREIWPRPGHV